MNMDFEDFKKMMDTEELDITQLKGLRGMMEDMMPSLKDQKKLWSGQMEKQKELRLAFLNVVSCKIPHLMSECVMDDFKDTENILRIRTLLELEKMLGDSNE